MVGNPYLVLGAESSGTTLLRRLVSMHPDLPMDLLHEERRLLKYKTAQEAENNYYNEYSHIKCGEKVPYLGNTDFIIDYIDKWKEFWPDSLIFHIIRKPEDVAISSHRRFKRPKSITYRTCIESVNIISDHIKKSGNFVYVSYEALTLKPFDIVRNIIYAHMSLEVPDDDYIKKVISIKEPWQYKEKRCCGLRYSPNVGRIKH